MSYKYLLIIGLLSGVIFLFYLLFLWEKPIEIKTVYPENNAQINTLIPPIVINFKSSLRASQRDLIRFNFNPNINFSLSWPSGSQALITPQPSLAEKTKYTISVVFKNQAIYQWSFSTPTIEQTSSGEQDKLREFFDPAGQALEKAFIERPWLKSLPVKEKTFVIDYLEDKQSFRVLMKIDITSSLSSEEQINQIKSVAPQKLKAIGVDLVKYKLYYTFTP